MYSQLSEPAEQLHHLVVWSFDTQDNTQGHQAYLFYPNLGSMLLESLTPLRLDHGLLTWQPV